jgi:hypothetical protein
MIVGAAIQLVCLLALLYIPSPTLLFALAVTRRVTVKNFANSRHAVHFSPRRSGCPKSLESPPEDSSSTPPPRRHFGSPASDTTDWPFPGIPS